MIEIGDKIRIVQDDLYLGKWLPVGTMGEVVGGVISLDQYLYKVKIDNETYDLAPSEFEKVT